MAQLNSFRLFEKTLTFIYIQIKELYRKKGLLPKLPEELQRQLERVIKCKYPGGRLST